uniref:Uncharacterized protein n=1 Tax=Chenopodium quinoa TaxID=63459 RepID=A0A803N1D2_CHEQI
MSGAIEGCLLGEKGEDEENDLMFIGDDEVGDDEAKMVVVYVDDYVEEEGSGERGGYCIPDEKECKSMVNLDCVTVEAPQVGMIFDTWQEADLYYNVYGKQQGFGVVLAQSAYKVVGELRFSVQQHGNASVMVKQILGGKLVGKDWQGS